MSQHDPSKIDWCFERTPIDWGSLPGGYRARYELSPGKIEMVEGKLFWSDADRLIMVGLLIENLGVDKVMQLGNPAIWKKAAFALSEQS